MKYNLLTTLMLSAGLLASVAPAVAQVAGTTTVAISVMQATQAVGGWSVKKSLLGKNVYNDAGAKVGSVEDLIISPDKTASYLIIGAGGFIGMGRHDVAIPVSQIQNTAGKLVLAGATKDSIKAMAPFDYAVDTTARDAFVAKAEQDIAKGKTRVADIEKKAGEAATDAKVRLNQQGANLKKDLAAAEGGLVKLKAASAARWKEFEGEVSAATARVRKAVDAALA